MGIMFSKLRYGSTGAVGINDTVYREYYRVYESDGITLPYEVALAFMQSTFPVFTPGPNETVVDRVEHRQTISNHSHRFMVRYRKNIPFSGVSTRPKTFIELRPETTLLRIIASKTNEAGDTKFVYVPKDCKDGVPYTRVAAYRTVQKTLIGPTADPDAVADVIAEAVGGLYNVPNGGSRLYQFLGGEVRDVGTNQAAVTYSFVSRARVPEITQLGGVDLDVPFPELPALAEYAYPTDPSADPVIGVIPAEELYEVDPPVLP